MVMIGSQNSPCVLLISTEPTIGPVQENDTSTRVSATKKTPARPPSLECESDLLSQELGSVISKAPKNEAAKSMKIRKKVIFGSQCVASQLKMSAVTVSPPAKYVIRMMTAMGIV